MKSTHGLDAVLAQSNKIAAAKQRAAEAGDAAVPNAAAEVVAEVDDDDGSIADTLETAWNCLEVARVVCLCSFSVLIILHVWRLMVVFTDFPSPCSQFC